MKEVEVEGAKYVDVDTAVEITSMCRQHVQRLARTKKVRSVKVGKKFWIKAADLAKYTITGAIKNANNYDNLDGI